MPSINLEIEDSGFLKFDPEIERRERELLARLKTTNEEMARRAVEILTVYPPEVPGNFPPAPYWQRGTGMINSLGETIPTQQSYEYGQSRDRWQYQTAFSQSEIITRASTNIPYAPYVGSADLQAWFHRDAGWVTDDEVVAAVEPEAQEAFNDALGAAFVDLFENT